MDRSRRDYYKTLNVHRDAQASEIRAAYRRKAKELHPDTGARGDAEAFHRVQEAYDVLKDPVARSEHDAYLFTREQRASRPRRASQHYEPSELEGLFEQLFGFRMSHRRSDAFYEEARRSDPFGTNFAYSDEGTDPGRWSDYSSASGRSEAADYFRPGRYEDRAREASVEFTVHMSPDEAYTGVQAHLKTDRGETIVVDIPPGVRDGELLSGSYTHRLGRSALRILIRVL